MIKPKFKIGDAVKLIDDAKINRTYDFVPLTDSGAAFMNSHGVGVIAKITTYNNFAPTYKIEGCESNFGEEALEIHPLQKDGYMFNHIQGVVSVPTESITPLHDPVAHPNHYTAGGIETLDFIKAKMTFDQFTGYIMGNLIKYITRFPLKNGLEDLEKAAFYLNDYIAYAKKLEKENGKV